MLNTESVLLTVPPGTAHPLSCPDCGSRLLLGVFHGRLQYRCEKEKCNGNSGADVNGKPLGIPIDKWGRRKRWELHSLIDPYWDDPFGNYWANSEVRSMIYRYFALEVNVEEFHISWLNHEELDRALILAKGRFVKFMEWNHIERKESAHDQIVQC